MSEASRTRDPERQIYWRRRRAGALRLLPFAGALLFVFPLTFALGGSASTARAGLFLFAAWAGLIAAAAWLARGSEAAPEDDDEAGA